MNEGKFISISHRLSHASILAHQIGIGEYSAKGIKRRLDDMELLLNQALETVEKAQAELEE